MTVKTKLTADQLMALLASKHAGDVFVAECKNGPTHSAAHRRLDAWVLVKTWSPWTTIGYEVKVSRADFEQDQKWVEYLPVCHRFSFVCPSGLVKASDLPPGVGLLWASANGERLQQKVRAERRTPDPEKLALLMSYVLMSRTRIVSDMWEAGRADSPSTVLSREDMWRAEVERATAKKELASFVRGHIRTVYESLVDRERAVADQLRDARAFAEQLAKLGVTWDPAIDDWRQRCDVAGELEKLFNGVDRQTLHGMRELAGRLTRVADDIQALRTANESKAVPALGGGGGAW